MYSKLLKKIVQLEVFLKEKNAAIQSTEVVLLFAMSMIVTIGVVVGINKMLGDGQTEENGGMLKKMKDAYEKRSSGGNLPF